MSQSKVGKSDKSQRKKKAKSKKSTVQFSRYIHRVLKSVAPNEGISKKSMSIMESFMLDVSDRITSQLHTLVRHERNGRKTIATKDIQAATKLVLPGIMESFMLDVFDRITSQLHTLVRHERNG